MEISSVSDLLNIAEIDGFIYPPRPNDVPPRDFLASCNVAIAVKFKQEPFCLKAMLSFLETLPGLTMKVVGGCPDQKPWGSLSLSYLSLLLKAITGLHPQL